MRIFYIILVIFVFTAPYFAYSQVRNTDISISTNPNTPGPDQEVVVTVSSFVTDLNKSYIIWLLDGEQKAQGVGKKSFSFNSGKLGKSITLAANIELVDGETVTKNLIINPTEIDLLWEAIDSYTPPFYKGKALATIEGPIKIVAIPSVLNNGSRISPNNLSYKWERNGVGQPTSSGWGRSYFIFEKSFLDKNNEIEVKISDILGKTIGQNVLSTSVVEPKVVFYGKDLEMGTIFNKSIGRERVINSSGETIVGIPYFFSKSAFMGGKLDFVWSIGNQPVVNVNKERNELSVKGEEGKRGQTKIQVNVRNAETIFQEASRALNVIF